MKLQLIILFFLVLSCSKNDSNQKPTYDRNGKETKECGIRAADGRGPYNPLGRINLVQCEIIISKYCKKKQIQTGSSQSWSFCQGEIW